MMISTCGWFETISAAESILRHFTSLARSTGIHPPTQVPDALRLGKTYRERLARIAHVLVSRPNSARHGETFHRHVLDTRQASAPRLTLILGVVMARSTGPCEESVEVGYVNVQRVACRISLPSSVQVRQGPSRSGRGWRDKAITKQLCKIQIY